MDRSITAKNMFEAAYSKSVFRSTFFSRYEQKDKNYLSSDEMTLDELKNLYRLQIEHDAWEINENSGGDDLEHSVSNELNYDKMTLSQLQDMVEKKKRKNSPGERKYSNLQLIDDGSDLIKQPISCLKSKYSKKLRWNMDESAAEETGPKNGNIFSLPEENNCVLNEISYEFLDPCTINPLPDVTAMQVDDSEMRIHQSELGAQEVLSLTDYCNSEVYDSPQCCPIQDEIPQQEENVSNSDGFDLQSTIKSSHDTNVVFSTSELVKSCNDYELQNPPERLLARRTAIYPTSREKLCNATNNRQLLDGTEQNLFKEKTCFENQPQNKPSLDLEESKANTDTKVITFSRQINKRMHRSIGCYRKRLRKCRNIPRFSTGSASVESCSRSAIAFSKRQLHEIEYLVINLTRELSSMKEIVKDTLRSETGLSTSSKFNADKMKAAVLNASNAEEASIKWVTMMGKDCNHFCKLMSLNQGEKADSVKPFSNENRKIRFADEAGGELCHVKIFDNDDISDDPRKRDLEISS